jgi:hypothetical protein
MLAGYSSLRVVCHTFQGFDGLALGGLLPDALDHRRDQLAHLRLDVVPCIACHEYVRVGVQALGAPIGAAALEVGDLLDARMELRLPRVFGNVDVVAVEYIVDRVGAACRVSIRSLKVQGDDVTCRDTPCGEVENSPPGRSVAEIVFFLVRVLANAAGCSRLCGRGCGRV